MTRMPGRTDDRAAIDDQIAHRDENQDQRQSFHITGLSQPR